MVAYEFASADVVFIPRAEGLNSGNIPMAYIMGKVVLGPDVANTGALLKETGNPRFDPLNPSTLPDALEQAFDLAKQGKGEENRSFSMKAWSTEQVGMDHFEFYTQALEYIRTEREPSGS